MRTNNSPRKLSKQYSKECDSNQVKRKGNLKRCNEDDSEDDQYENETEEMSSEEDNDMDDGNYVQDKDDNNVSEEEKNDNRCMIGNNKHSSSLSDNQKKLIEAEEFLEKIIQVEEFVVQLKDKIGTMENTITSLQQVPTSITIMDKNCKGKVSSTSSYVLHPSQLSVISKFVSDIVIHEVKIFDKVIESKKGLEYASSCAERLNIPEVEKDSALISILSEIKNYVTTARNNQLRDLRAAFFGKYLFSQLFGLIFLLLFITYVPLFHFNYL